MKPVLSLNLPSGPRGGRLDRYFRIEADSTSDADIRAALAVLLKDRESYRVKLERKSAFKRSPVTSQEHSGHATGV